MTPDYNTSKLILNVLWCPSGPESFYTITVLLPRWFYNK
nr:MAG TPA: hypothetical protein [Caudoviricetes sp.]